MSAEETTQTPEAAESAAPERKRRKTIVGVVTSDKMQKTRIVSITRLEPHKRYGKYVRRRTTFMVHDEKEISREGDRVRISESRPISKGKNWRLVEIVERSRFALDDQSAASVEASGSEGASS